MKRASTLRLRLNYATGSWNGWTAFAEFDYVGELIFRDFNSLGGSSPDRDRYPVVADPKGPDLNQLVLRYAPSDDATVWFGRNRIVLDNHRFVGDVGWRQNVQTFDGVGVDYTGWSNVRLSYTYVTAVRRIFGDDVPAGRHDTDNHLLNVNIRLSDDWIVIPYFYYIDNHDAASFSTSTFGARLTGDLAIGDGALNVVAELATQSDAANNPVSYDAEYFHASAFWVQRNGFSLGVDFESLGGDQALAGAAFRTPLATLHPFQGWADKFLTTPGAGVNDFYVTVRFPLEKWKFTGVYHDFSAESGSADWGTELDLLATRSLGDRYGVTLKAAFYDANQHATDTNKYWIMFTAAY